VALDIALLTEGQDYVREGGDVCVLADVLIAERVTIELLP